MLSNHSKSYDVTFFFVCYRFFSLIAVLGLLIHFQYLSSNVFLLQCLYGVVSIPANVLGKFSMNYMGRRITQMIFMSLMGISILTIIFLPQGEKRTRDEQRKYIQDLSNPNYKKLGRKAFCSFAVGSPDLYNTLFY